MFKKIGEVIFIAVVLCITAFGAVHIAQGCIGTPPAPPPPGQRVLITEKDNVKPEAFVTQADGQAAAVVAPVDTLPGSLGGLVKNKFTGKEAILTSEPWLKDTLIPNSTIIYLDVRGIYDLINQTAPDLVTQLAAKVVPAAAAPWIGPLAMFLPLLIPNFRRNTVNAVTRVIPGVSGPDASDTGKVPDIHDFRQAISDLAQAVTLQKADGQNYARPNEKTMTVPING